ncbi:DsbA family protein [Yoonia sediminilitoris]|uniref:Protein-disulfide isomerase n=1 Tax=Yoonia sediminilitoris TaxID=1286148 RepID=A0A2T6K9T1_9RHOB|nr:DsbA family protein [Yoonia sediminilitoris]PUB11586.1 protein-disulfide isomerase [Yoonia sediminilitoris]RCW91786.1 protein-disulfide isomerase [Yoonia sediminilitoris]
MERRTLLAAGGGAILALGGGFLLSRPDPETGLLPGAANAQTSDGALPDVMEMVAGNPDATVEVTEYASFTCPHCASFHANQYQQIKANYIDTGKIKFVYREVYFDRPGLWASMIARCPNTTEFFFGMAELLYEKQKTWLASGDPGTIVEDLRTLAKTAGLDDAALDACLSDGPKAESLFTWYQANAERDSISSTPSFLINGEKYSNMGYDEFASVLDEKIG